MNRILASVLLLLAVLAIPTRIFAQESNITDDEIVDVTADYCDPSIGDDCTVESVASMLATTTITQLNTYSATYVSPDLFNYGYDAYVEAYVYQDGAPYASGVGYDDGSGAAELDGFVAIPASPPYAYTLDTDSYIYDTVDDVYIYILSTAVDATIGPPDISSISPSYAFVGTGGALTLTGQSFLNAFGGYGTQISASLPGGAGSGFGFSGGTASETSVTADYTVTLGATTGVWGVDLSYFFGPPTALTLRTGGINFTVGDPPPAITKVTGTLTAGGPNSVTISGSYFGSAPVLAVSGAGATSAIVSHSDSGLPGGAVIDATISVPACAEGNVTLTVTSTGYNGTGFFPAHAGESSSASTTLPITVVPAPAVTGAAPEILFNNKNLTGNQANPEPVVSGQQISLSGQVPVQACVQVQSWNWGEPGGTAIANYVPTVANANVTALSTLPTSGVGYGPFYWAYTGTNTVSLYYVLTNGVKSATANATFTVSGPANGTLKKLAYDNMAVSDVLKACTDPVEPGGIYLVYAKAPITGTSCPKGGSTSPELGITFSSPGPAAPGGSYFAVQVINSDAVTNQPTVGPGLDVLPKSTSYKYGGTGVFPVSDSPSVCLSCTNLLNLTRAFSAVMFVMWQSTTPNSIPVPAGYEVWSFKGQAINSNGWKMNGSASTSPGKFVPSAGNQTGTNPVTQVPLVNGFPTWTGSVQ